MLQSHGIVDIDYEVKLLTIIPKSVYVLVEPSSRVGQILKKYEHLIDKVDGSNELKILHPVIIPMYAVKKSQVIEILERYNKEIK